MSAAALPVQRAGAGTSAGRSAGTWAGAATPLQRHALVWLEPAAWSLALATATADDSEPGEAQALDCLAHWAAHDLPLVVTRQPSGWPGPDRDAPITLGLAAPAEWGRRRHFVRTSTAGIRRHGHFPAAAEVGRGLPGAAAQAWAALCAGLQALGTPARVYGSHGWQALTGLIHTHASSDIDLLLQVADVQQADAALTLLLEAAPGLPRIDGEFVRADGTAVAWREWAAWRSGRVRQVLVKGLCEARLLPGAAVFGG